MSDIQAITYDNLVAVTPGTGKQFSQPAAGFICNVAGNVQLIVQGGLNVTLAVLAGVIYPIAFYGMLSAGTTATGIFAVTTSSAPYRGLT